MSKSKEMTLNELKKLIKQYDAFMSIKIPKGVKKPELVKIIEKQGYKIDHDKKVLVATFKQKTKKLPKKVELPPPPSPEEVKKKKEAQEKRMKEKKKKDKDQRRELINKGREIQKKVDMIQMKKKEKKDKPKPAPKKPPAPKPKPAPKKKDDKETINQKKSRDGWDKYFKIVEDNKELLKSDKRRRGNPFSDSYDYFKRNQDVSQGRSNFGMNYDKWISILNKKIKDIKDKKKPAPKKKDEPEKSVLKGKKATIPQMIKRLNMLKNDKSVDEDGDPITKDRVKEAVKKILTAYNSLDPKDKKGDEIYELLDEISDYRGDAEFKWNMFISKMNLYVKKKSKNDKEEVKPTKKPSSPPPQEKKPLSVVGNLYKVLTDDKKNNSKEVRDKTLFNTSVMLLDKDLPFTDFRKLLEALDEYDDIGMGFTFYQGQAPPKYRMKLSKLVRKYQALQEGELKGIKTVKELQADWIKQVLPKGKVKIKMK